MERARIRYTGDCICRLPLLTEDEKEEMKNAKVSEELCGKCDKMRISVCDMVCFGTDIEEVIFLSLAMSLDNSLSLVVP